MTPERLRIPKELYKKYEQKALFYREAWVLCALSAVARDLQLFPVLRELESIVEAKRARRGLKYPHDELMQTAFDSLEDLSSDPFKWAQRWLKEFRDDPGDNFMVVLFADHWQRQFQAMMEAIKQTRP